ncbi:phage tail tape measure protein [Candidatus Woesearchaeota archaeon]|nr:MAG: phage tail tape measure protein [Candidatus Woesearchaeota archaeon]
MPFNARVDFEFTAKDNVTQTLNNIKRGISGLSEIAKTAAGVLGGMLAYDALNKVKDALEDSVNMFAKFEEVITRTVALSGAAGEEAEKLAQELQAAARAAGLEFGVGAVQAAEALESLVKAGLEGEAAIKALNATLELATIENISAGQAADLLVGVLNQFKMSAEEAEITADMLVNASAAGIDTASDFALALSYVGNQAAALGFTLEETLAALVALNNQGIAAEKAGRYLNAMLTDLIEHYDKLGFSIYDSEGNMLSLTEIIENLANKLNEFSTEEERAAYLTEVFGSQGMRAALGLLNLAESMPTEEVMKLASQLGLSRQEIEGLMSAGKSAGEVLEELSEKIKKSGTASEVTRKQLDTTAGVMKRMNAAVQDLMLDLGEALAPLITDLANFLRTYFVPSLKFLIGGFRDFINFIKPHVLPALQTMWNILKGIYDRFSWLGSAVGGFMNALSNLAGSIYNSVKPALDTIKGILDAISGAIKTIQNAIGGLFKATGSTTVAGPTVETEVPAMQEGGIVTRPTLAFIGEGGPEAVIPLDRLNRFGNITVNVTISDVTISNEYDLYDLARQLGELISDELRVKI